MAASYIKYIILAVFVIIIPLLYKYPGFCKYICPAGTLEAGIPLAVTDDSIANLLGAVFRQKVTILILIAALAVFVYRGFCRFICPLGAIYSFFNKTAFFGMCVDRHKCIDCGKCVSECKMDIRTVGDRECIACGECKGICPVNAICRNYKKER